MGSGHILAYAFDVLMDIYRSQGYTDRDAVRSIVENNLYGLDIDDRAAQLAYFCVMMKACQYDRRFLRRGAQPHVCAVCEPADGALDGRWTQAEQRAARLLRAAFADAKEYGSILTVSDELAEALSAMPEQPFAGDGQQRAGDAGENLRHLAAQARVLGAEYDVVVTNPPYMGASGMNDKLGRYVKEHYPDSKSDLFAVFMEKGNSWLKKGGYNCMVTMQSWMFLSSFEKLRARMLRERTITALMHMENMVMGIAFGTAVTVFNETHIRGYKGTYNQIKLNDIEAEKPREFPVAGNRFAQVSSDNFFKIPGSPVAYWVSERMLAIFQNPALSTLANPRQGLATGENDRFLRSWFEVALQRVFFHAHDREEAQQSQARWFPYNKGGDFRKWYGNNDCVVNWENDGDAIRHFYDGRGKLRSVIRNPNTYFVESITWSKISSGVMAFRYKPYGHVYDVAGTSIFARHDLLMYLQGFCNSCIAMAVARILSPTINYEVGHISNFPIKVVDGKSVTIQHIVEKSVALSKNDWDSFETSWDFKSHPLI